MATGYDNRQSPQGARLAPTAPRQTQARGASGAPMGRSGVVQLGENTGGVVRSQNPSISAGIGSSIPGFLEKVFEPVIQERQTERMYAGMQAAMEGATMQEIQAEQPSLSGLFGATAFEQGASYQHARQGVAQWQNDQLANMEALKQLAPEEVSKVLYDGAKPYLTGDSATDTIIHKMVIEASETLIPQVTRARIEWRDGQLRTGMINDATARGGTLASVMAMDNPDPASIAAAVDGLKSAFVKPPAMPAESWLAVVDQAARGFIANGNLRAFNVMSEGGANSLLFMALGTQGDGTKYQAILNLADTASKDAASEWAARPENARRIDLLNARVATREIRGSAIREEWDKINEDMINATGSLVPLRTPQQITADVEGYVNSVASEDRATQRAAESRVLDAQSKLDDEANKIATIRTSLLAGDPQETIMAYGPTAVDNVMRSIWQTEPQQAVQVLSSVFTTRGTFFADTAADMQNLVEANTRAGADSEGFRKAYQVWSAFDTQRGGIETRARYFGKYDAQFMRYETLTSGAQKVPPLIAFNETFGQAGVALGTQGPGQQPQGQNRDQINKALDSYQPGWIGRVTGRQRVTGVSREVMQEWVAPEAARRIAARPGLDPDLAVRGAVEGLIGAGAIDRAGAYYWETPSRGPGMSAITGLSDDRLGNVVEDIIRDQTRTPTFAGITPESVRITAVEDPGGTYWTVWGENRDGVFRGFTMTKDMITGRDRDRLQRQRREARSNAPGVQLTSPLFGGYRE